MYIRIYLWVSLKETDMKYLQTATDIKDFEQMAATARNMVDGEYIVRYAAKFMGETSSEWKRNFCAAHLSRFSGVKMYRILMGEEQGNKREYHYVPNPF